MKLRLRSTRALLAPVAVLAVFSHHVYPEASVWDNLLGAAGLILLLLAMGGRIWASAHLVGNKNEVLVTGGPYRLVRNPLYLFSLIGFIGAGLAFESLALALLFALIFFASHWPTIRHEEQRLGRLFGDEYERYRARVPRMIPSFSSAGRGSPKQQELTVDERRFKLALRDCMAIPMIFVIADLLEWAKVADVLPVLVYLP